EIPLDLWIKLIEKRLSRPDCVRRGWLLEGIPKSREEALCLQASGFAPEHVVMLQAPDDVLTERSLGKRIDPVTGDVYHLTFMCPESAEVARRLERPDCLMEDKQISRQLQAYHRKVQGLQDTYSYCLKIIDADQPHEDVFDQVLSYILCRHRSNAPHTPRILLFGPPGCGKSLQGGLLAQKYNLVDVCCGELLKAVAADESSMGELIKPFLESGRQVPDNMVLKILTERLSRLDCTTRGWVLHGFPRDVEQAERLQESNILPSRIFFLEMSDDVALERQTLRFTDPVTGDRFHSLHNPAPSAKIQARLQRNPRDAETEVCKRLQEYRSHAAALKAFYPQAVQKKMATGKRKGSFENPDHGFAKQRKLNAKTNIKNEDQPASKFPSKSKPKSSPRKGQEEHKEHDRPFVKTSSLFRNNPEIPDVLSPAVTQVKEKIFTGNSFHELDLHPHLVATLNKLFNISSMTSVQKQTLPVLMSGQDAVVRSQTGSGKTLAYGIPLVQSLQAVQPKINRSDGPLAVVIVPTRELAQQSFQIFQKLLKPFTWIVPGVLMGGEKRKAEKARLRKGINVLISTPGRLVDHIKNTLSIDFKAVRWLVLDEADRTLDLGFEKDLTVILNALNAGGSTRQTVLLSATLTEGLSRLTSISMKEPVYIQVSDVTDETTDITKPSLSSQPAPSQPTDGYTVPDRLQQYLVVVPSKLRLVCLAAFILARCKFERDQKLIVFISSCEAVEFLATLLSTVLCADNPGTEKKQRLSINFLRLHGNMEQEERTEVFQVFSQCKAGVLLCTDVAARGLDLPQVTWIVQFNPPTSAAEYVHRVGRTARIGAQGKALLFLTPAETTYTDVLANHNISLGEMKVEDILSTLMDDERFRGRGNWDRKKSAGAREQDMRERATVLQTEFENHVHSSAESVQAAKKALQSFVRAYTAYPSALKHIFHIRHLHLGHAAKSFGLRDAPQGLSSASTDSTAHGKAKKKAKGKDTT
ncbi:putative ATP-dependent RNA helicase DDX31, partial [Clarias magur]